MGRGGTGPERCAAGAAWPMAAALLALLIAAPALARAQVATPGLGSGGARFATESIKSGNRAGILPDNPAALLWGGPGRVILGGLRLRSDDRGAQSRSLHQGGFAGVRLNAPSLAAGLELLGVQDLPETPQRNERAAAFQFAGQVADFLAWGLERGRATVQTAGGRSRTDGVTVGLSFRLLGWLYLGGAIGNESLALEPAPGTAPGKRDLRMAGVAVRTGEERRFYAELSLIRKDGFDGTTPRTGRYEQGAVTVQGVVWNVLAGVTGTRLRLTDRQLEQVAGELGFAPRHGPTLIVRRSAYDDYMPGRRDRSHVAWSVLLGWLF